MLVSRKMMSLIKAQEGWTRKMFEAAIQMKKTYGAENVYDFSLGNPDVEPPPEVQEKLLEVVAHPVGGMHRYMPNPGYEDVRGQIADYLEGRTGLPFTSHHVFMTVGCAGGLNIVLKSMLNRGDEVIIPNPFFWEFKNYVENFGGVAKFVETKPDFQLDIKKIKAALSDKTKAILINSPNNPTGVVYDEESLKELANLFCKERKKGREIFILSDDAYRKLVYSDGKLPELFTIYDLVISVTSHSKDLALPGERIGYVAISPQVKDMELLVSSLVIANRVLGFVNAPALFQRLVAGFQNTSVSIAEYEKKRDVLYETLMEAGFECVKPTGAFYMFPKSPIKDELEFVTIMQQEERILVVPGRGFGRSGYIRIAYCVPLDTIYKARPGFLRVGKRYTKKR
ncbi:MAG TPA: pyridoxal phosphate-dependent aminotransferase [Syntrophorhabdales bacterium]|nr:pyridoxal phosphate-dependent aminotransferase [Syntrophorhabdales bacterium]